MSTTAFPFGVNLKALGKNVSIDEVTSATAVDCVKKLISTEPVDMEVSLLVAEGSIPAYTFQPYTLEYPTVLVDISSVVASTTGRSYWYRYGLPHDMFFQFSWNHLIGHLAGKLPRYECNASIPFYLDKTCDITTIVSKSNQSEKDTPFALNGSGEVVATQTIHTNTHFVYGGMLRSVDESNDAFVILEDADDPQQSVGIDTSLYGNIFSAMKWNRRGQLRASKVQTRDGVPTLRLTVSRTINIGDVVEIKS